MLFRMYITDFWLQVEVEQRRERERGDKFFVLGQPVDRWSAIRDILTWAANCQTFFSFQAGEYDKHCVSNKIAAECGNNNKQQNCKYFCFISARHSQFSVGCAGKTQLSSKRLLPMVNRLLFMSSVASFASPFQSRWHSAAHFASCHTQNHFINVGFT